MKRMPMVIKLFFVLLILGVVSNAVTQIQKGKTRPLMTKQWMKGVIEPHCKAIKKGLEANLLEDKAWKKLAVNAAVLNESSYVLMADGRCPDRVWATAASETLRIGSTELLKAIESKDIEATKSAFSQVTKSCGACHEAHKKKEK